MAYMTKNWLQVVRGRRAGHYPVMGNIEVHSESGSAWSKSNKITQSIRFKRTYYRYECQNCGCVQNTTELLEAKKYLYCDSCKSKQRNWKYARIVNHNTQQYIYLTKDEAENIVKDIIKNLYCKATSAKKMELIKLLAVDSPEEK